MDKKFSINFYKAYVQWKSAIEKDRTYNEFMKSLSNKSSGDTALTGIVGNKILDLGWVKTIEDALPHVDKAIRESRSFIEQKDEIVTIEKVKRVNTQSIRHLAQHTNLIAKVEDNGDVMPNRILNIYYESSFAIYENRFLYTLLGKLVDFVEKRYLALKNKEEKIDVDFNINKLVRRKNKISKMNLNFQYKTNASLKFDLNDDTSSLSGFTRVLRIRSIIHDFYSSSLIKSLAGVETVKPPIIHTNLISKNVSFRSCLELWDYLSRYKGLGYTYEDKEFKGKMPLYVENHLHDIFVFSNFLSEITFNTELKNNMQKSYYRMLKTQEKAELQKKRDKEIEAEKTKKKEIKTVVTKSLLKRKILDEQKLKNFKQKQRDNKAKLKEKYQIKLNETDSKIKKLQMQKKLANERYELLMRKYTKKLAQEKIYKEKLLQESIASMSAKEKIERMISKNRFAKSSQIENLRELFQLKNDKIITKIENVIENENLIEKQNIENEGNN